VYQISSIEIPDAGLYEINYYVLMISDQGSYTEALITDSIGVLVNNNGGKASVSFYHNHSIFEMKRRWLKQTQVIELGQGELKVNKKGALKRANNKKKTL
jgi:hypothetical protein